MLEISIVKKFAMMAQTIEPSEDSGLDVPFVVGFSDLPKDFYATYYLDKQNLTPKNMLEVCFVLNAVCKHNNVNLILFPVITEVEGAMLCAFNKEELVKVVLGQEKDETYSNIIGSIDRQFVVQIMDRFLFDKESVDGELLAYKKFQETLNGEGGGQ